MPRHRNRGKKKTTNIKIPGTWEFLCSHVRRGWAESNLQQLVRLFNTLVHHTAQLRQPTAPPPPAFPITPHSAVQEPSGRICRGFASSSLSSLPHSKPFKFVEKMGRSTELTEEGQGYLPEPALLVASRWGPVAIFKFPFVEDKGPFLRSPQFLLSKPNLLQESNSQRVFCSAT